jgi:hypothetical protein
MCSCERSELIRNGGFEIEAYNHDQPLEYWTVFRNVPEVSVEKATSVLYEGNAAAAFESQPSADLIAKSASLRQAVGVTPGCIYQLSFAENFLCAPTHSGQLTLTARVFYLVHEIEFDLIRIPIIKVSFAVDENKGYSFHARTFNRPVPCDVSGVIVQFDFTVKDTGDARWLLDGVSLRAVFPTSAC